MPHEGFVNSVMPSRYEANVFVEVVPIYTSREVFHARRHSKNRNQINSENTFLRKKRIPIPNIFFSHAKSAVQNVINNRNFLNLEEK